MKSYLERIDNANKIWNEGFGLPINRNVAMMLYTGQECY